MPTAPKASQDVMLLIGQLLEEAKAASDGLKRAMRLFGEALGNSLYNKRYIKEVAAGYHAVLVGEHLVTSGDPAAGVAQTQAEFLAMQCRQAGDTDVAQALAAIHQPSILRQAFFSEIHLCHDL